MISPGRIKHHSTRVGQNQAGLNENANSSGIIAILITMAKWTGVKLGNGSCLPVTTRWMPKHNTYFIMQTVMVMACLQRLRY
ncbi:hypothetical protein P879_07410 [Paragonimus westermani]|uniref:Uncharacterized protein n=1 Tax=Paragonimus westermani TaxID=34504 RepID=A0A8T0D4C0_9TREM|nr:hypothetical protein P879_07410 [Paragonimus westermani]